LRLSLSGRGGQIFLKEEVPYIVDPSYGFSNGWSLQEMVAALELAPKLFSGEAKLLNSGSHSLENELLSGEHAALILVELLGNEAYIIHPDALSISSAFD